MSARVPGKRESLFKPFFFADQGLEELVQDISPKGGPLADAAHHLRDGDPGEAEVVLAVAMASRPDEVGDWHRLLLAAAQLGKGNPEGAAVTLRQLVDATTDSRTRLWAWTALRRLGQQPDDALGARVEGVIVEVEVGKGVNTLAAYRDGKARYLLHTGAKVIWDAPDKRLEPAVTATIAAADRLSPDLPLGRLAGEPGPGQARMTLLTASGPRAVEEPLTEIGKEPSPRAPLFGEATTLLEQVLAIAKW